MRSILRASVATAAVMLSGCAYVTATPITTANDATAKGVRVFSPRPYVVVNGDGVSTIYLPDCSREYAIDFGTVLAKNEVSIDLQNGMLSKLDSKEDSTVIGTNFLSAVTEAVKAGKSLGTAFSAKADGGTDTLSVYEVSCDTSRKLSLKRAEAIPTLRAVSAPTAPPSDGGGDGGVPLPKH